MPYANVKLAGLDAADARGEHAFANTADANGGGKPLEISGANLMYEGARVKSWLLGRDVNPAGRGDGAYYAQGAFSIGCDGTGGGGSGAGGKAAFASIYMFGSLLHSCLKYLICILAPCAICLASTSPNNEANSEKQSFSEYYSEIVDSYWEELSGDWNMVDHCKMLLKLDPEQQQAIAEKRGIHESTSLLYAVYGVLTPIVKSKGTVLLLVSESTVFYWALIEGAKSGKIVVHFIPAKILEAALFGTYDREYLISISKSSKVDLTYYNVERMGIICVSEVPDLEVEEYYLLFEYKMELGGFLNDPLDSENILYHSDNERKKYYIKVQKYFIAYSPLEGAAISNETERDESKGYTANNYIGMTLAFIVGLALGFFFCFLKRGNKTRNPTTKPDQNIST